MGTDTRDGNTAALPVICYLCGRIIVDGRPSDDHVVPKQMIKRAQPRAKGYDYAGKAPTHEDCNNRFGPERYYVTALRMLEALESDDASILIDHPDDRNIQVMALNTEKFGGFDRAEMEYFKLIDGRTAEPGVLPAAEFFADKKRTNPKRDALHVALSVLAKSAAALLVTRHIDSVPTHWRIFASAFWDETDSFDIDAFSGETTPFDDGLKVWIKAANETDWQIAYRAGCLVVLMVFVFSDSNPIEQLKAILEDADINEFQSDALEDLLTRGWNLVS